MAEISVDSGDIDKLLYISTVPSNYVPKSAVSNTVLMVSEISSVLIWRMT